MLTYRNGLRRRVGCSAERSRGTLSANFLTPVSPAKSRCTGSTPGIRRGCANPMRGGQTKFWILEIPLVGRARTFGGFYERLLVPGCRLKRSLDRMLFQRLAQSRRAGDRRLTVYRQRNRHGAG
jgi:hypothetical protein